MGIQEVLSAPRAPWQRAYVERVIGTLRRECLDHVIVFNEASLYACQGVPGVLSRIQDAPFADQGPAGTAAGAPAGTGRRCGDTASRWPSPPLRAASSLNVGSSPPFRTGDGCAVSPAEATCPLSVVHRGLEFDCSCRSVERNIWFAGVICSGQTRAHCQSRIGTESKRRNLPLPDHR